MGGSMRIVMKFILQCSGLFIEWFVVFVHSSYDFTRSFSLALVFQIPTLLVK
jgi:hypothetical protein